MTSTRFPPQTPGQSSAKPSDQPSGQGTEASEPRTGGSRTAEMPSVEAAAGDASAAVTLRDVVIGDDIYASRPPIVGKTVDVSKMKPSAFLLAPPENLKRNWNDPPELPSIHWAQPPIARMNVSRAPRTLMDTIMRRPEVPVWVESETLSFQYAPAGRIPVRGIGIAETIGTRAQAQSGEIRYVALQVAPSSIYLAHFGAAVAAAAARGDDNMQAFRVLPNFAFTSTPAPIQSASVVLYANLGDGALEPVVINTDARVHMTHDGGLRALQKVAAHFELTYPTLENAFSRLVAAAGAWSFKPFDPLYRATNADAIGHALSAVTGTPTRIIPLDGMSQNAIKAELTDRHQAVILTFAPDTAVAVPPGTVPQAQWHTYRGPQTPIEQKSGRPAPEVTLLADVPYAVTHFFPESGHVELLNVLKNNDDPTWYEGDAQGIHQALTHQKAPTLRVPLTMLADIPGVQLLTSKIPYAVPTTETTRLRMTPQGPRADVQRILAAADTAQAQSVRDTIATKLFEGALTLARQDAGNPQAQRLAGSVDVSVVDDIITLTRSRAASDTLLESPTSSDDDAGVVEITPAPPPEAGRFIAHLLRSGNQFVWTPDPALLPAIRAALAENRMPLSSLGSCLLGIAQHAGFADPASESDTSDADVADIETAAAPQDAPVRSVAEALAPVVEGLRAKLQGAGGSLTVDQLAAAVAGELEAAVLEVFDARGISASSERSAIDAAVAETRMATTAAFNQIGAELMQLRVALAQAAAASPQDATAAQQFMAVRHTEMVFLTVTQKVGEAFAEVLGRFDIRPLTETPPGEALTPPTLSAEALTALRDPNVAPRLIGVDVPVADLTARQRADIGFADTRPWYERLVTATDDVIDSSRVPMAATRIGTLVAPGASVYFQGLSPDLIAPSRTATSHFAAALGAAVAVGGDGMATALTMRSLAQTAPTGDGVQQHTVMMFTGRDGAAGEDATLVPTPINVTNAVFAGPDGGVRAPRSIITGTGRVANEGSLPFHGYAVLENAFQKLAAQDIGYVYKPFESETTWAHNPGAIGNALAAVTGNPALVTKLTWAPEQNSSEIFWPARPEKGDIAVVTVPTFSEIFGEGAGITMASPFSDTPSVLIKDENDNALLLSNVPYAVVTYPVGDKNKPSEMRVVLRNVLATGRDPLWYDDAPDLPAIIARQSVAPIKLGQDQSRHDLIAVTVSALQKVGATVYTSSLHADTKGATAPVQAVTAEGVRDIVANLEPVAKHAAFKAWVDTIAFTQEGGTQQSRGTLHVRKGGEAGAILASFVRAMPGETVLPHASEKLLRDINAHNAEVQRLAGELNAIGMALQTRRMDPAQGQAKALELQGQLGTKQTQGRKMQDKVPALQAEEKLARGGVRRLVDGIPGDETTLLELLQAVFAEQ